MLPDSLSKEIKLFQNSPLANKLFIVVSADTSQGIQQTVDTVSSILLNDETLSLKVVNTDKDFMLAYYYGVPEIFNEDLENQLNCFLTTTDISKRVEDNIKRLCFAEGIFLQDFIIVDPIGMFSIFADRLKILDVSGSLEINNGFLISKDSKHALFVFDYPKNFLDGNYALKIDEIFKTIKKDLPENTSVFYMGAPRYTVENRSVIVSDMSKIFAISTALMIALFLVFLRDKKAIFIYVMPAVTIIFAAVITFFTFKTISGITIGFGSVLMGLSVDYSVYMYFAMKSSTEENKFANAKKMFKPIFISAMTSIFTFMILFFSNIGVFRQIALFCAGGLLIAMALSFLTAAFIFDVKKEELSKKEELKQINVAVTLKPYVAWIIVFVIFSAGIVGFKFVQFDISLQSLNTVTKNFENDRKEFEELIGGAYDNNAMVFVLGKDKEEVLENNEKLFQINSGHLKLAELFPSQKTKANNVKRWKNFWTAQKIADIKKAINKMSIKYAIKPDAFDNFYNYLNTGQFGEHERFDMYEIFNPIIQTGEEYAFVNIVPAQAQINNNDNIETVMISNEVLQKKIVSDISSSFFVIVISLIIFSFVALVAMLKSFKLALLSLLPPLCSICIFFAMAALLSIKINLFGLFAMPLLLGLGIDYGLFVIFQNTAATELHPTKAVVIAAFSTLIGFGSLMAAQHKVLFIIGFMVFTGILTAILVSIFILPAFLKNIKKNSLALLAVFILFSGCASISKVHYNIEPEQNETQSLSIEMFYGVYEDSLPFNALTVTERDGNRVVIMSDLGVKLLDMKVKNNGETDIYFYMSHMPKNNIEEIASFFTEYFFDGEKKNIEELNGRINFYNGKNSVLWMNKI
ncbi:MMPL family transporter [Endomicrobium proavitum]|nr:MMPL family transporter [Endomicrobium proavitum]